MGTAWVACGYSAGPRDYEPRGHFYRQATGAQGQVVSPKEVKLLSDNARSAATWRTHTPH